MSIEYGKTLPVDELRLQRLKKKAARSGTWEGMCFWLRMPVQEGEDPPFYPLVAVWVDQESGMIVHHDIGRPENGAKILCEALIQAMETAAAIPEHILVSSSTPAYLFKDVAKPLGIILSKEEHLPAVHEAVEWLQSCMLQEVQDKARGQRQNQEHALMNQVEEANHELLALFESWLTEQGLSRMTRVRHLRTVDLYLNSYLMDIGPMAPDEGVLKVDDFFVQWLPKASPWVSASSVQGMIPGLKKFAVCLHQQGLMAEDDLQDFMTVIKTNRKRWQKLSQRVV